MSKGNKVLYQGTCCVRISMKRSPGDTRRKQWIQLAFRILRLYMRPRVDPLEILTGNYDKIASDFDKNWTLYMHGASDELIQRLPLFHGERCLDLCCGTGYVTARLFEKTSGEIIGVDASRAMLDIAKTNCPDSCRFIQEDVLAFLYKQPKDSFDIITCAWALGYFPTRKFLTEIYRVLRPRGYLGIIDHSRRSNHKMVALTYQVFAENPTYLSFILRPYYLKNSLTLVHKMRRCGYSVRDSWDSTTTFYERDAGTVIARLLRTGSGIGGLDFMMDEKNRQDFFHRYEQLIEERYRTTRGIPIEYNIFAAVGTKQRLSSRIKNEQTVT
jgi:ubiquinone/menaquinone biosynthesis C-methylase UbiE